MQNQLNNALDELTRKKLIKCSCEPQSYQLIHSELQQLLSDVNFGIDLPGSLGAKLPAEVNNSVRCIKALIQESITIIQCMSSLQQDRLAGFETRFVCYKIFQRGECILPVWPKFFAAFCAFIANMMFKAKLALRMHTWQTIACRFSHFFKSNKDSRLITDIKHQRTRIEGITFWLQRARFCFEEQNNVRVSFYVCEKLLQQFESSRVQISSSLKREIDLITKCLQRPQTMDLIKLHNLIEESKLSSSCRQEATTDNRGYFKRFSALFKQWIKIKRSDDGPAKTEALQRSFNIDIKDLKFPPIRKIFTELWLHKCMCLFRKLQY